MPNYSLTSPTMIQALSSQRRIAGSTSLVEIKADNQHLATMKDALRLQPGVIIQDMFGGNDQLGSTYEALAFKAIHNGVAFTSFKTAYLLTFLTVLTS